MPIKTGCHEHIYLAGNHRKRDEDRTKKANFHLCKEQLLKRRVLEQSFVITTGHNVWPCQNVENLI